MKWTLTARKALLLTFMGAIIVGMLALAGCSCSAQSSSAASSSAASTSAASGSATSSTSASASSASDTMTVPNVVSLTQADADKALAAAGFAVGNVSREASDSVPSGCVISQDPKALSSAKRGTKVNLVVSTGKAAPKDVQVPDLKGKTQVEAEQALSNVGLVGVASNPEESTDVAPGQVFKQSIDAGTTVKEGAKVAFTVALAPALSTVPDVTGMAIDDAQAAIVNAQLGFDTTYAYDDNVPENVVMSQSIAGGVQVTSGTTVSILVSLGAQPPAKNTVPDVVTYSWSDAQRAIISAGLDCRYTGDPAGVVVAQSISAGTEVDPGTLVTVLLADADPTVAVPDLSNMSVTTAEITTDGLKLALDTGGNHHGTVTSQWPEAGTFVDERTTIFVTVDTSDFK